jgi:hypothetical protein
MAVIETNPIAISVLRRPEDAVEFLAAYIALGRLGFEYIARYDEPLLPKYPAVQIMSGQLQKDLHGTHTWLLTIRAEVYVFHAKMTESRQTRSREDLLLATKLVDYLERDITLGDRVIAGWVESEQPGARPPATAKGAAVISTRLLWSCTNEARF